LGEKEDFELATTLPESPEKDHNCSSDPVLPGAYFKGESGRVKRKKRIFEVVPPWSHSPGATRGKHIYRKKDKVRPWGLLS